MRIDIDAARAARLEAEGEPHELLFGGTVYEVPAEAPWRFVHAIARGQTPQALAIVLGADGWDQIAAAASREDVKEIVERLLDVWGIGSMGERPASGSSSPDGGSSSRPTSPATTAST